MGMFYLANHTETPAKPITVDQSVAEIPQSLTATYQTNILAALATNKTGGKKESLLGV